MPLPESTRPSRRGAAVFHAMLLGALLGLPAAPAHGQPYAGDDPSVRVVTDPASLEARAYELMYTEGRYRDAAAIYLEAAVLRGAGDPVAVENQRLAASLFFYTGDRSRAQAVMEAAAQAALAMGDVETAANRFMDAAFVARERGENARVIELVGRARLLTASPLLDGASRQSVLRRIAPDTTEVRRSRITLPTGVELEVAETGTAEGEAVLFLHGFTDSWVSFSPILERLPADVRGIAPSMRGHGDSERPDCCYAVSAFVADAVALLDELGVRRAVVVGHSMGSFIAQQFAIDHPERVRALVLVGTADTPVNPATAEFRAALESMSSIEPGFAHDFQMSTVAQPVDAGFMERVTGESLKLPIRVWCDVFAGLLANDARGDLPRISAPTLVLGGDRDAIFTTAEQARAAKAIPGARFLAYGGVGHAPHWEAPDRFVGDLITFMADTGR